MSLLNLWRELGRDYVDAEHDGQMKEALLDAAMTFVAIIVLCLMAIVASSAVPS